MEKKGFRNRRKLVIHCKHYFPSANRQRIFLNWLYLLSQTGKMLLQLVLTAPTGQFEKATGTHLWFAEFRRKNKNVNYQLQIISQKGWDSNFNII